MKIAHSKLHNKNISASEAHEQSLTGIHDTFSCPNKDCHLSLICTHYGKSITPKNRIYFRNKTLSEKHTGKKCSILNLFNHRSHKEKIEKFVLMDKNQNIYSSQFADNTDNKQAYSLLTQSSTIYGSFQQLLTLIDNDISVEVKIKGKTYNSLKLKQLIPHLTIAEFENNIHLPKLYRDHFYIECRDNHLIFRSVTKVYANKNYYVPSIRFSLWNTHPMYLKLKNVAEKYKHENSKDISLLCTMLAYGEFYKFKNSFDIITIPQLKLLDAQYIAVKFP